MNPRINFVKLAPDAMRAMAGLEHYLANCGLEKPLRELVKLRASQINGCAYCIDMHWKDARAAGETEQRLYGLDAWQESPYYTDRERAALAWTEALTLVSHDHVPNAVFESVRPHFSEKELADLTWAVAQINAWNRVAIALRSPAGKYQPAAKSLQENQLKHEDTQHPLALNSVIEAAARQEDRCFALQASVCSKRQPVPLVAGDSYGKSQLGC